MDDYNGFIQIRSDSFAGDWYTFEKFYIKQLIVLWDKIYDLKAKKQPRRIDLALQRKLLALDNQLEEISQDVAKIIKKAKPFLSTKSRFLFDSEMTIKVEFSVSKKHSCYNENGDNVVYKDEFWNYRDIDNKKKYVLDRREDYYFSAMFDNKVFDNRYKKKTWSSIIYYLYNTCSYEDIMCVDNIFVDIIPMLQFEKHVTSKS